MTGVGENNDEVNIEILNGGNSGSSKSFGGADRVRGEELDVREEALVVDATLSFTTALGHDGYSFKGVHTTSRLSREHDCVSSIKDGVGNI